MLVNAMVKISDMYGKQKRRLAETNELNVTPNPVEFSSE